LELGNVVLQRRNIYEKSKYNASFSESYYLCQDLVDLNFFEKNFGKSPLKTKPDKQEVTLPTIVILTAINVEYKAVREHLEDLAGNNLNKVFDRDLANESMTPSEQEFYWIEIEVSDGK